MTRKHYIAIAKAISAVGMKKPHYSPLGCDWFETREALLGDVAEEISQVFQKDNPRFSPRRFFEACGVNYDL